MDLPAHAGDTVFILQKTRPASALKNGCIIGPEFMLQSGSPLEYRALSIRPKTCLAVRIVSLQRRVNSCFQKTAKTYRVHESSMWSGTTASSLNGMTRACT